MGEVRPVLAVSHPGHELLVHAWLTRSTPRVFVLTDGSGRAGRPRIDTTTGVLNRAGIATGGIYGRHGDAAVYAWILNGRTECFVSLARELAKEFASDGVDMVVGDAAEGYNPIHDAFRLTLNTAVAIATREGGREVTNYDFPLFGMPGARDGIPCVSIELSDDEREQKRREAARYVELEREVEWSLKQHGRHAFDREILRLVRERPGEYQPGQDPPIYERYGDHLAQTGQIERVIRLDEHLQPLARALAEAVDA